MVFLISRADLVFDFQPGTVYLLFQISCCIHQPDFPPRGCADLQRSGNPDNRIVTFPVFGFDDSHLFYRLQLAFFVDAFLHQLRVPGMHKNLAGGINQQGILDILVGPHGILDGFHDTGKIVSGDFVFNLTGEVDDKHSAPFNQVFFHDGNPGLEFSFQHFFSARSGGWLSEYRSGRSSECSEMTSP